MVVRFGGISGMIGTILILGGAYLAVRGGGASADVTSQDAAVLAAIRAVEGTSGAGGYSVCYGYDHTIQNYAEHPDITGEWHGKELTASQCKRVGLGPGCKSTAAGAYQIIVDTWRGARDALGLRDFSPASQDAAAMWIANNTGALDALDNGDIQGAIEDLATQWDGFNAARWSQGSGRDQVAAILSKGVPSA
jgi:lysozyme